MTDLEREELERKLEPVLLRDQAADFSENEERWVKAFREQRGIAQAIIDSCKDYQI